jgi:nucleotide-binding universal stress UspA family protein
MHVIVATDGSKQSLSAARHLKSFADPARISNVTVVAVIRPLASVAFADELSDGEQQTSWDTFSFREAAENAVATIAAEFDGWGPKVQTRVRSGSPANEIIKVANQYDAGLVVVAAGGRGLSSSVLIGSTAQRVQHYAPCPVLVVRPVPRKSKSPKSQKAGKAKKS